MLCPQCGKEKVEIKREKRGEVQNKGGVIREPRTWKWWATIGWLIVLLDLCTLGLSHLFIKWSWFYKNSGQVVPKGTVSVWRTVAFCKDCGYTWETASD